MPKAIQVNPRSRPARKPAAAPAPARDRAAERAAAEAAALERDRPYIAQALDWAAQAQPGDIAHFPDVSVVGLAAACAAVCGEGFACEVRGCSLALLAAPAAEEGGE